MTSRNTPTRTYCYTGEVYIITLKVSNGSSLLITHFTVHLQDMYTCIIGRESLLTASWVARIRDSAAAVHEAAATLGLMLKKEQEKVIVAFTQGHDDFVALPTGFGCYCCLPYVFDKLRGFTNGSIAVVVSPLKKDQVAHCTSIVSLARPSLSLRECQASARLAPYSRGLS